MKNTQTEPAGAHHRPSGEAVVEDYAWRFRLVRSTLEDFNQLIEDKSGRPGTKQPAKSVPATKGGIARPGVTPARSRLTAMTV